MFGLFWAAAVLLGAAGTAKLIAPAGAAEALGVSGMSIGTGPVRVAVVRAAGLGELGVAAAAVGVGGRWAALLLAIAYGILALVAARLVAVAPGQDCGCFGARTSRASHWHTAVDVAGLLVALVAVVSPTAALSTELGRQPLLGLPATAGALLLAWLAYQLMTALPELNRARALVGAR